MTSFTPMPPDRIDCPNDCPFLGMRTFLPDTLPFYCNKYETFLGAVLTGQPARCARCLGVKRDLIQEGLAFISAYTGDKRAVLPETKEAFLHMGETYRRLFVDFIAKTGAQIALVPGEQPSPEALLDQTLLSWREKSDLTGAPEAQAFKAVLDQMAADFPLFARETQTLLMNLFLVMDASEKEMLKNVLQNARQVESFLDSFAKQPQDRDLLRNMRALLYDYDRQDKTYQQQLQQQKALEVQQQMIRLQHFRGRKQEYQR